MSDELRVVATIAARPGSEDAVRDALATLAAASRDEPGCRSYELFSSQVMAGTFVTVESWDDQAALDTHLAGSNVAATFATAGEHLADQPTIHTLTPV